MKKQIAVAMAAFMTAASLSAGVYADDAAGTTVDNPIVMNWEDIDETIYDGAWFETGLGFDLFLPEEWEEVEVTDEMAEQGLAFMAGEPGGGANITITCTDVPADYTIEQLGEELAASMTTAAYADLSGLPAVIFDNDDTKTSGFCAIAGDYLITGIIAPPSDDEYEAFGPSILNIIMSVSETMDAESDVESIAE